MRDAAEFRAEPVGLRLWPSYCMGLVELEGHIHVGCTRIDHQSNGQSAKPENCPIPPCSSKHSMNSTPKQQRVQMLLAGCCATLRGQIVFS